MNQTTQELESFENEINTSRQNCQNCQNSTPFPVDALPETLRKITLESSEACLVPPALSAMVSLGCLSTAIGGGLCIESTNGRTLNGNLFLLVVAKSGTGKGTTYSTIAKPILECNGDLKEQWKAVTRPDLMADHNIITEKLKAEKSNATKDGGSAEKYKELLRDQAVIEDQLEKPPTLLVGETTEQRLAMIISGQNLEAVGNHSAEARGIIKIILGRFGSGSDSTGETIYCAGYSGDSYSVERAGRADINMDHPCLSCLFMIQPDVMKSLTRSDAMSLSGFMPRFLMADVHADLEDDPEDDRAVSEETAQEWSKLIKEVIHHHHDSGWKTPVAITQEAGELLREESNRVKALGKNGARLERFHSYVARYGENLRKLHLVLHVAVHGKDTEDHPAGAETARQAIQIARWFFDESMLILMAGQAERQQKLFERLVKIIRGAGGEITLRDLTHSHTITEEDITELQEVFPDALEVVKVQPDGGGRPSTKIRFKEEF